MNITLSIDNKLAEDARKVAADLGKSLNQLIREHLEQLTRKTLLEEDLEEFKALSGQGNSQGWEFNRDELHERT